MTGNFIFPFLLFLSGISQSLAPPDKPRLSDCESVTVRDTDRRSFHNRTPSTLDGDGNSGTFTITPRTFTRNAGLKVTGKRALYAREIHWIAFDLRTDDGHVFKSFFKYDYGDDRADSWVYAFVPCRANRDRRT